MNHSQHALGFWRIARFHGLMSMLLFATLMFWSTQAPAQKSHQDNPASPDSSSISPDSGESVVEDGGSAGAKTGASQVHPPFAPSPLGESLHLGNDDSMGVAMSAFLRMIVVLAGVLLLAYLLLHKGLGKLNAKLSHGRLIRVVDRVGLEPKKILYVVEVADHHYLIGSSDAGLAYLATLDEAKSQSSFADLVQKDQSAKSDGRDHSKQGRKVNTLSASETASKEGANNA